MQARDLAASALWGTTSRPLRSLSLVASLAAGVASVVFVTSVIAGFGREIDRMAFGAFATALAIQTNPLVPDRIGKLRKSEAMLLRERLRGVEGAAMWRSKSILLIDGNKSLGATIYGVEGEYEAELDTPLTEGRYFSPEESRDSRRLCLIGAEIAAQLPGKARVGGNLLVGGARCEVIGVLGEPNSRPSARFAQAIITPLTAAERYFITPGKGDAPGQLDRLTLFMSPRVDLSDAEMRADLLLRKRRGISLARPSPFSFGDPSASVEQLRDQRRMLGRLLSAILALSLGSSLTAYAAIAASTMAARQREIALRRVLGAGRLDVQLQILCENLLLGLAGGATGLVIGVGLGRTTSAIWHWPFAIDVNISLLAISSGLLAGAIAGAALAARASGLSPALAVKG